MRRLMHVLALAGLATIRGRRRRGGPGIGQGAQARWHSQLCRRRRAPQLRLSCQYHVRGHAPRQPALFHAAQVQRRLEGHAHRAGRRLVLVLQRRRTDLHLQAAAGREVPRWLAHDVGRREGHLRPHHQSARRASSPRAAPSTRTSRRWKRRTTTPSSSASRPRTPPRSTASPRPGTASTAQRSSRRTRDTPRPRSWARAPSPSSSM